MHWNFDGSPVVAESQASNAAFPHQSFSEQITLVLSYADVFSKAFVFCGRQMQLRVLYREMSNAQMQCLLSKSILVVLASNFGSFFSFTIYLNERMVYT